MTNKDRISIRAAKLQEHTLLSAIAFRSKASWGYSAKFMELARAELTVSKDSVASERIRYWVAELSGGVAGFVAIEAAAPVDEYSNVAAVINDEKASNVVAVSNIACRLDSLFVDPLYMGKGVGKRLVCIAKCYARECGAMALLVQSDPYALPFYLAVGGVQIGASASGSIPGRYLPEICIPLEK